MHRDTSYVNETRFACRSASKRRRDLFREFSMRRSPARRGFNSIRRPAIFFTGSTNGKSRNASRKESRGFSDLWSTSQQQRSPIYFSPPLDSIGSAECRCPSADSLARLEVRAKIGFRRRPPLTSVFSSISINAHERTAPAPYSPGLLAFLPLAGLELTRTYTHQTMLRSVNSVSEHDVRSA